MTFSIFLDDAYLDYSNLIPKITAKFNDVKRCSALVLPSAKSALASNGERDSESEL